MPNNPPTPDFYAELRAVLNDGNAKAPKEANPKGGDAVDGLPPGSATEQTSITPLGRRHRVEVDHGRALNSLKELAKRNEEAERRAKATVHAVSAKYLKMLEKNPDVHEGDPLFFFGYGLECMEDIIYAGFYQVNASVSLYLEELDARFQNLLVMAEEIDAAQQKAKPLANEFKDALAKAEASQSAWREDAKGQVGRQLEGFIRAHGSAQAKLLEAVLRSNRSLKRAVGVLVAVLAVALGVAITALFYIIKIKN